MTLNIVRNNLLNVSLLEKAVCNAVVEKDRNKQEVILNLCTVLGLTQGCIKAIREGRVNSWGELKSNVSMLESTDLIEAVIAYIKLFEGFPKNAEDSYKSFLKTSDYVVNDLHACRIALRVENYYLLMRRDVSRTLPRPDFSDLNSSSVLKSQSYTLEEAQANVRLLNKV
jgi:hypothetical protein